MNKRKNGLLTAAGSLPVSGYVLIVLLSGVSTAVLSAPPPGWYLVWSDTFTTFDETKWSKGYKWGKTHNHRAYMADSAVEVKNGVLRITATEGRPEQAPATVRQGGKTRYIDYTSGAINSSGKFSISDAYVEARIKTSGVRGTWPAFWMLSDNGGWPPEIDIMESPVKSGKQSDARWYFNFHYGNDWKDRKSFGGKQVNHAPLDEDFHDYGMAWSTNYIEFYFDGELVRRFNRREPDTANRMYLILNLAIGGWAGDPADPFNEAVMEVDWVKVYKWGGQQGPAAEAERKVR